VTPDVTGLLTHWGYGAIFLAVVLGNVGFPVPEETILAVGGYMAQRGEMHLPLVLVVGFVSAVTGDGLGYWIGRHYGRAAIERYGRLAFVTPARLEKVSVFVRRYGGRAVFGARFVTGLRFLAGPLAGATGLPPATFFTANVLGAIFYIPYAVGLGYAVAYGFGDNIERVLGRIGRIALIAVCALTVVVLLVRLVRARRAVDGPAAGAAGTTGARRQARRPGPPHGRA
jgi:membrane protein DedA with SNARE-associated domain